MFTNTMFFSQGFVLVFFEKLYKPFYLQDGFATK